MLLSQNSLVTIIPLEEIWNRRHEKGIWESEQTNKLWRKVFLASFALFLFSNGFSATKSVIRFGRIYMSMMFWDTHINRLLVDRYSRTRHSGKTSSIYPRNNLSLKFWWSSWTMDSGAPVASQLESHPFSRDLRLTAVVCSFLFNQGSGMAIIMHFIFPQSQADRFWRDWKKSLDDI